MWWEVTGVNLNTGKDAVVRLQAATEAEVPRVAKEKHGLIIEKVRKIDPPAAQPSIAPAVHASHAKPALSNGEMLGVMLNRILSGLCYAAGILYFVSYVINLILASRSGAETLNTAGIAEYFVAVRCLIAFGVGTLFQLAAGQILTRAAIRSLHR